MTDHNRLDARVSVLESGQKNVEGDIAQINITMSLILKETQKFNHMISWGKGGVYTLAAIGAVLVYLWDHFKSFVTKVFL